GNSLLWALHDLNRRDKHISLLTVATRITHIGVSEVKVWEGQLVRVGPKRGKHMVPNTAPGERGLVQHDETKRPTWWADPPRIECGTGPTREKEEIDFLTCAPGTKFEADFKPTLNIAFGDVKALKCEPIVAVLHQMRQLVDGILLAFDRRFS